MVIAVQLSKKWTKVFRLILSDRSLLQLHNFKFQMGLNLRTEKVSVPTIISSMYWMRFSHLYDTRKLNSELSHSRQTTIHAPVLNQSKQFQIKF